MIYGHFNTPDTEAVLLSSLVLSDQSFTYKNKRIAGDKIVLLTDEDVLLRNQLEHYQEHVLKNLSLKAGEVLLWIFRYDDKAACLTIDADHVIDVRQLINWNQKKLNAWIDNIKNFYFSGKQDYDGNMQEHDYNALINDFQFAKIVLPPDTQRVFYCSSVDVNIPPHLLINNNDFIGALMPVSNVLSIQRFLEHHQEEKLSRFNIDAWVPADDANPTISWGLHKLAPVFERYNVKVQTQRYPEVPLAGSINVFLAHGIRDKFGFKVVKTNEENEHLILDAGKVFGKGELAMLFICNSGSFTDDLYATQLTTFAGDLLKSGYKVVVAPYWPYDVTMSGRWLSAFLESFESGKRVDEAVFLANSVMANYDEETSTQFYAPAGMLAMHVYGNPNLYYRNVDWQSM
jgi:hypothetical protein